MQIPVTCPSGLSGTIRGFKAREANVFTDQVALKSGLAFDSVLSNCWLDTANGGPYSWLAKNEDGTYPKIDWARMLVCDRFWALLKIREATYGKDYVFKVRCQDDTCNCMIEWELDLEDLPMKELPAESRLRLLEGENSFEAILPDGKKCAYKLQTGMGERETQKAITRNKTRAVIAALNSRIITIEGLTKTEERLSYLEDLDLPDLMNLIHVFDAADGGIETDIEIECTECSMVQQVSLPLGGEFFLPQAKKKALKIG